MLAWKTNSTVQFRRWTRHYQLMRSIVLRPLLVTFGALEIPSVLPRFPVELLVISGSNEPRVSKLSPTPDALWLSDLPLEIGPRLIRTPSLFAASFQTTKLRLVFLCANVRVCGDSAIRKRPPVAFSNSGRRNDEIPGGISLRLTIWRAKQDLIVKAFRFV